MPQVTSLNIEKDPETRPYVAWDLVENFMIDAFKAVGVPEDDAGICAEVLLESDRRGIESHGCNRFKPIYIDRINAGIQKPVTEYEVIKDTPTTLVVDAHDGMGMVASYTYGFPVAEEAFREAGVNLVTLTDYEHVVEKALETGYIKETDVPMLHEWREDPANWRK